jgi:hypothetical protein
VVGPEVQKAAFSTSFFRPPQVGTGDIVGNPVFEAFDEAVRGMAVGETVTIKARRWHAHPPPAPTKKAVPCPLQQP